MKKFNLDEREVALLVGALEGVLDTEKIALEMDEWDPSYDEMRDLILKLTS